MSINNKRKAVLFVVLSGLLLVTMALSACQGSVGSAGPQGPKGDTGVQGSAGPAGPSGKDGINWPGPVPASYESADGIAGGAAYSKWWVTEAVGTGSTPETTVKSDFYRCKSCHGWDGLGNAGSYANRTGQSTGKATRPDVAATNLRSAAVSESYQELHDLIAHNGARVIDAADNTHPDYSKELTPEQTWNIVKFMKEEWVNPGDLYDLAVTGAEMHWDYSTNPATLVSPALTYSNIGKDGNSANGNTLFQAKCAGCHGSDGKQIEVGGKTGVGQFVRQKPHEAWFKVKFGEPGTGMTPGLLTETSDLKDIYKALTDTTTFPD